VLIVSDPNRVAELARALSEPLPQGAVDVLVSSGGDDTIDLFEARRPPVVVISASLEVGDAKSLIEALRGMAPRAEVAFVVVGDDTGPIRTALDAMDLAPDRFVSRPLADKALRFAVQSALEAVALRVGSMQPRTKTDRGTGVGVPAAVDDDPTAARAAMRARWEAIADSIGDDAVVDANDTNGVDAAIVEQTQSGEPEPLPPPILIHPRRDVESIAPPQAWRPGTTDAVAPPREPTLIIRDPGPEPPRPKPPSQPPQHATVTERGDDERWSAPIPLAELVDRTDRGERDRGEPERTEPERTGTTRRDPLDELPGLDDFADDLLVGHGASTPAPSSYIDDVHGDLDDPELIVPTPVAAPAQPAPSEPPERHSGRDFARQLRAKMSMMAQRLFQTEGPQADVGPRHDHQTEIDLAALGEEPALGGAGVTEIVGGAFADARELTTSPGSWDTQVRERGLPDSGEIVRGVSDAALLLAKLFAQATTGRVGFRRGDVEKIVYFDAGRPVFASSNEPGDRMGELLVREGKITAAQYERCQANVERSGRRMGEILVDFGYLKRRELLPAVRRHVEDIVYSLFGWDHGHYLVTLDPTASGERIRLSRHPASLVLEGIRRKLDRTTLERLVGPASTVIEVADRERLGGIVNTGDLAAEERAALAAFDGQGDLAHVARAAGVDVADILPLAWGLCVLGLATARRADAELEESTALVGETDLAIDRERVRARWELVTEADYFALLGVRRDATGFEIRRAYQSARRDFAADCFPLDLRRELARELDDIATVLDEAFRVLRDDRLRLTYLSNLLD
jgi:hypothetical protein